MQMEETNSRFDVSFFEQYEKARLTDESFDALKERASNLADQLDLLKDKSMPPIKGDHRKGAKQLIVDLKEAYLSLVKKYAVERTSPTQSDSRFVVFFPTSAKFYAEKEKFRLLYSEWKQYYEDDDSKAKRLALEKETLRDLGLSN